MVVFQFPAPDTHLIRHDSVVYKVKIFFRGPHCVLPTSKIIQDELEAAVKTVICMDEVHPFRSDTFVFYPYKKLWSLGKKIMFYHYKKQLKTFPCVLILNVELYDLKKDADTLLEAVSVQIGCRELDLMRDTTEAKATTLAKQDLQIFKKPTIPIQNKRAKKQAVRSQKRLKFHEDGVGKRETAAPEVTEDKGPVAITDNMETLDMLQDMDTESHVSLNKTEPESNQVEASSAETDEDPSHNVDPFVANWVTNTLSHLPGPSKAIQDYAASEVDALSIMSETNQNIVRSLKHPNYVANLAPPLLHMSPGHMETETRNEKFEEMSTKVSGQGSLNGDVIDMVSSFAQTSPSLDPEGHFLNFENEDANVMVNSLDIYESKRKVCPSIHEVSNDELNWLSKDMQQSYEESSRKESKRRRSFLDSLFDIFWNRKT